MTHWNYVHVTESLIYFTVNTNAIKYLQFKLLYQELLSLKGRKEEMKT